MRKRQTAAIAELERLELKDAEALCGADGEARVALVQADAEDPLGAGFGGHLGWERMLCSRRKKKRKKKRINKSVFLCVRDGKNGKRRKKRGHISINLFIFLFPLLHPSQTKKRLGTEHITERAVQQRGTQGPTRWARSRRCRQGQT